MLNIPFNPRRAIHDAFAIQLKSPDKNNPGSGTKIDSNYLIACGVNAGKVMSATMNQTETLRSMAIFVNAPEGTIKIGEMIKLREAVWKRYEKRFPGFHPDDKALIFAAGRELMEGFKLRCWNDKDNTASPGWCVSAMGIESDDRIKRAMMAFNRFVDVLQSVDTESLMPIYALIDRERERQYA